MECLFIICLKCNTPMLVLNDTTYEDIIGVTTCPACDNDDWRFFSAPNKEIGYLIHCDECGSDISRDEFANEDISDSDEGMHALECPHCGSALDDNNEEWSFAIDHDTKICLKCKKRFSGNAYECPQCGETRELMNLLEYIDRSIEYRKKMLNEDD